MQIRKLFILKLKSNHNSNLNVWYLQKISYCGIHCFCSHYYDFQKSSFSSDLYIDKCSTEPFRLVRQFGQTSNESLTPLSESGHDKARHFRNS